MIFLAELAFKSDRLLVCRQEQISRSQFRRLTALHRERFANRLILVCALTILSVLAGLGTFFIYSAWG